MIECLPAFIRTGFVQKVFVLYRTWKKIDRFTHSFKIFLLFRLAQILWLAYPEMQVIERKSKNNREALATRLRRLSCFVKAGENGGKLHTLCEEEMAELLPKNVARTAKIHLDGWQLLFEEYLQDETSLYILNLPKNRQMKTGTIEVSMF